MHIVIYGFLGSISNILSSPLIIGKFSTTFGHLRQVSIDFCVEIFYQIDPKFLYPFHKFYFDLKFSIRFSEP